MLLEMFDNEALLVTILGFKCKLILHTVKEPKVHTDLALFLRDISQSGTNADRR